MNASLASPGRPRRFAGDDFDPAEGGGELREEQRIARAAAGNDELREQSSRQDPAMQGGGDGERREYGCGADQILGTRAVAASPGENFLDVSFAVLLAAGGLGRRLAQIFFGEESVQQGGQKPAAGGHARVAHHSRGVRA